MKEYDHLSIEKKWQKEWEKKKVYKTLNTSKKKKYYVLDMFPYPSGVGLHVGHPKGYIGSDVFARFKRMQGFNVLHPMGYDAFGLPAEQYALEHHIHPRKAVLENVKAFEAQLNKIGFSYDWERRVNTTDPEFYRWTQWIFLKIYNSWYNQKTNKAEPIEKLIKIFEKSGNVGVNAAGTFTSEFVAKEWNEKIEKEKQDILMNYRLAYEGYSEVNWSPVLGTVLANDEVVDGPTGPVSERGGYPVVKKEMRQWFLRITAYADRLAKGLDTLNWSDHIKEIQKNWIGKSVGAEIDFKIKDGQNIRIFTTRPDTIFGVTYLVLAPEHPALLNLKSKIRNWDAVSSYINKTKLITPEERMDSKEKTGVILRGIVAINPANGEEIPVWIADYVLVNYGTGAIMAVPAHDERDLEFAQKYILPFNEVIIEVFGDILKEPIRRDVVKAIIVRNNKVLLVKENNEQYSLPGGSYELGESDLSALSREIREETEYKNFKIKDYLGSVERFYRKDMKNNTGENRVRRIAGYLVEITNEEKEKIQHDGWITETKWFDMKEAIEVLKKTDYNAEALFIKKILENNHCFVSEGILVNSGKFNGFSSEEAKIKITKEVGGKIVTKYKIRDAIFARQRYWGEPIPLVHTKDGIIKPLGDKSLPLKLPDVKSYEPTGTGDSPLAGVKEWMKKGLETNTMPGWAGSSWYYLAYMTQGISNFQFPIFKNNTKAKRTKEAIQYWKNVDMYVGGQEHATGHLLYSRFWHKVLKDYNLVPTEEPFQTLRNQGMILGEDNRKMGKRWGNGVNPDDVVKYYGADTLRVYEMFMGPFESSLPWSTDNIIGSRRFLDKVWRLQEKVVTKKMSRTVLDISTNTKLEALLHKTIKKVGDDINNFAFNTAVSSMMILANEMEKQEEIKQAHFEMFLKVLNPFAPHMTEEIWKFLGNKTLLVNEKWPKADPKKMLELEVKIVIQVNGKVRADCMIILNTLENDVIEMVKTLPDVEKWLLGKEIKKVIYIPNRLVNLVIF
ncbi:MAG: NUDIX domain-containing protein [Candidatus Zambryskibacteria bacterium]|nr:NUDIX domain-containing protein [Candidatus Zambryskibacteria bacterium]